MLQARQFHSIPGEFMQIRKFRGRFAGLIGLTLALLAVAKPADAQHGLDNMVIWRDGFVSSAQPGKDYLKDLGQQGFDMVVNLAPPQSMGSIDVEGALVGSQGVRYVNIPVDFKKPTADDFKFFSDVMKAGAGKKILVHCQVNMRGSSFSFLYRVIFEGAPVPDTLAKLTSVWAPDPVWKRFIEETLAANGKKAEVF
jgi:protein tyrosine phosphatase (PTP) superfamily phosphohydrolase (DUF442 family)